MLIKDISFKDYNGNDVTRKFCFDLSQAEVLEWEVSEPQGLEAMLQEIVETQDKKRIVEIFKLIVSKSYGEISEDGLSFKKSEELSNWFLSTPAYSALFMEMLTTDNAAADFVNAVIPNPPESPKQAATATVLADFRADS